MKINVGELRLDAIGAMVTVTTDNVVITGVLSTINTHTDMVPTWELDGTRGEVPGRRSFELIVGNCQVRATEDDTVEFLPVKL